MIHASRNAPADGTTGLRPLSAEETSGVTGAGDTFSVASVAAFNGAVSSGGYYAGQLDPATITGNIETWGRNGTGGYFVWHETTTNSWGFWADTHDGHDDS